MNCCNKCCCKIENMKVINKCMVLLLSKTRHLLILKWMGQGKKLVYFFRFLNLVFYECIEWVMNSISVRSVPAVLSRSLDSIVWTRIVQYSPGFTPLAAFVLYILNPSPFFSIIGLIIGIRKASIFIMNFVLKENKPLFVNPCNLSSQFKLLKVNIHHS